ncbi:MAG: T9SS type A sorting domain-containing protein [Taibaiella sp.]|nr:T9SS type A sorting domain-containing protein [Taibaiella sp.]
MPKTQTKANLRWLKITCIVSLSVVNVANSQTINAFAGTTSAGYTGDGGAATSAKINNPRGIWVDPDGTTYLCDYANNCIRKISTAGIITTIAGSTIGVSGFSGDGGLASSARLRGPFDIAKDNTGNIYIVDLFNYRIRKITTSGIISTIAGDGIAGSTGNGGSALSAHIIPYGVTVDSHNNVYITEPDSNKVRVIKAGKIYAFAGNGMPGYSGDSGAATLAEMKIPTQLAVDIYDNVYICDQANNRIRKVSAAAGVISTYAGTGIRGYSGDGGAATSANLAVPVGIGTDVLGNVFFSDAGNSRIRKINSDGNITTIAGNGTTGDSGDGGPAISASLGGIQDIGVDNSGNIIIADGTYSVLRRITYGNTRVRFIHGQVDTFTIQENSIATSLDSLLAIADPDNGQTEMTTLFKAPNNGTASISWSALSTGMTIYPTGITYTPNAGFIGKDTLIVWVNDGFSVDTSVIIVSVVKNNVGVRNQFEKSELSLKIVPNPNNGSFVLNVTSALVEPLEISIFDLEGRKVKKLNAITNKEINITSYLNPGVYFINAYTQDKQCTSKITIE